MRVMLLRVTPAEGAAARSPPRAGGGPEFH